MVSDVSLVSRLFRPVDRPLAGDQARRCQHDRPENHRVPDNVCASLLYLLRKVVETHNGARPSIPVVQPLYASLFARPLRQQLDHRRDQGH